MNHENGNGYRTYPTGATRDTGLGKLELSRYTHPAVFKRYGEFMKSKQKMPDGSFRRGDNWQEGIPEDDLLESLMRHITDIWLHLKGWGHQADEDLQTACCAALFNVSGILLHALVRERDEHKTASRHHQKPSQEALHGDRVDPNRDFTADEYSKDHAGDLGQPGAVGAVYPGGSNGSGLIGPEDGRDRTLGGLPEQGEAVSVPPEEPVPITAQEVRRAEREGRDC